MATFVAHYRITQIYIYKYIVYIVYIYKPEIINIINLAENIIKNSSIGLCYVL